MRAGRRGALPLGRFGRARAVLAVTHDLQAGRIDGEVDGAVVLPGKPGDMHRGAPAREGRVVRRLEVQAHQTDQRGDEALCLQLDRGSEREVA